MNSRFCVHSPSPSFSEWRRTVCGGCSARLLVLLIFVLLSDMFDRCYRLSWLTDTEAFIILVPASENPNLARKQTLIVPTVCANTTSHLFKVTAQSQNSYFSRKRSPQCVHSLGLISGVNLTSDLFYDHTDSMIVVARRSGLHKFVTTLYE